jgi:hypothetical protein
MQLLRARVTEMPSCPQGQLSAPAPALLRLVQVPEDEADNKGVCMADRGNPQRDNQSEDMARGGADEQIRGVASEEDDDFEDAEDLDEEEEDEEGTV